MNIDLRYFCLSDTQVLVALKPHQSNNGERSFVKSLVSFITGNGTACLIIKSGKDVYKFNHRDSDVVNRWVDKITECRLMDIFMNDQMIWAQMTPHPATASTSTGEQSTSQMFGRRAWRSEDSVFSYTSTVSSYDAGTHL